MGAKNSKSKSSKVHCAPEVPDPHEIRRVIVEPIEEDVEVPSANVEDIDDDNASSNATASCEEESSSVAANPGGDDEHICIHEYSEAEYTVEDLVMECLLAANCVRDIKRTDDSVEERMLESETKKEEYASETKTEEFVRAEEKTEYELLCANMPDREGYGVIYF